MAMQTHRIVFITPQKENSTIHEVDEETDTPHSPTSQPRIPRAATTNPPTNASLSVINLQNAMENESLLETATCNGNSSFNGIEGQGPLPGLRKERAATMTATDYAGSAIISKPRHAQSQGVISAANSPCATPPPPQGWDQQEMWRPSSQSAQIDIKGSDAKLDLDAKNSAKYGSTLSNLGAEYLKASGAIAVRFKQLQKYSQSNTSLDQAHGVGLEDMPSSTGVTNLCTDLPVIVPMSGALPKRMPVVPASQPARKKHRPSSAGHHIGYRLGRRKALAEQRRKVADYSCLLALIGITLMVIETECSIANLYDKVSVLSLSDFIDQTLN